MHQPRKKAKKCLHFMSCRLIFENSHAKTHLDCKMFVIPKVFQRKKSMWLQNQDESETELNLKWMAAELV